SVDPVEGFVRATGAVLLRGVLPAPDHGGAPNVHLRPVETGWVRPDIEPCQERLPRVVGRPARRSRSFGLPGGLPIRILTRLGREASWVRRHRRSQGPQGVPGGLGSGEPAWAESG